jgi:altronate dehydratase small subunit
MPLALVIHREDTIATALDDIAPGPVSLLGESSLDSILAAEPISRGHKLALQPLDIGAPIIKYGVTIGHATCDIAAGAWIHIHNCASPLDPRSTTLDKLTGAPTDTRYD